MVDAPHTRDPHTPDTERDPERDPEPLWKRWWFWLLIIAMIAIGTLIAVTVAGGGATEPGAGESDRPAAEQPDPPASDPSPPASEPVSWGPIATSCWSITHSPPPGAPGSPSWFALSVVLATLSGVFPEVGATATASIPGADGGEVEASIGDNGTAVFVVPISAYGTYAVEQIAVTDAGQTTTVDGDLPVVEVTADEQPLQCTGPDADALQGSTEEALAR